MVQDDGTARLVQCMEDLDAADERGQRKIALMQRQRQVIAPWLVAHGINPSVVSKVVIEMPAGEPTTITAYRYALNDDGRRYVIKDGQEARVAYDEPVTISLECWPENV